MRDSSRIVRRRVAMALAMLPLVAVAIAVALLLGRAALPAEANTVTPELSIAGKNLNCDTNPNTAAGSKCIVTVGSRFTVEAFVDKVAGAFPDKDGDTVGGYEGINIRLAQSAALTLMNRAFQTELGPAAARFWPDCGIAAENKASPTDYQVGCGLGIGGSGSIYTGKVAEVDYNCTTIGAFAVTLVNGGPPSSHITTENGAAVPDGNELDTLTINCIPPDGHIQIDKIDSFGGALIGPSCWDLNVIVAVQPPPPLTDPVFIKSPVGIVGDNGLVCPPTGVFQDGNPSLGQIDITVPGALLFGYPVVYVQERVPPPKYDASSENLPCSFATSNVCELTFENTRSAGNAHIRFNDAVTGDLVPGQCIYIDPPIYVYEADRACDNDGFFDQDPVLGEFDLALPLHSNVYSLRVDPATLPPNRQVVPPDTIICTLTQQAPECAIKFTYEPLILFNLKLPTLQNLFLTAQGAKLPPASCETSTDVAVFTHALSNFPTTPDPKDPSQVQRIGAFELGVRADPKLVCVTVVPGQYAIDTGMICFGGGSSIGCVTRGKDPPPSSSLELARIVVRPQPELYSLIRADQDNGVVVQLLNQDCNLVDLQGHPIQKTGCPDSDLTIRWLEGDVNGDCAVDVPDQQLLAFRWGSQLGSLLYNSRLDLEPSAPIAADGDIDIKDVQFVFGRHGSACQAPHPPQPPQNGKLTNP